MEPDPESCIKEEVIPRLRELCMTALCESNSYEEIAKLNIPTEMKDILLQKSDADVLFNMLCAASGMGILSILVLFASRGSRMLPYLNDKLRSAKNWRERLMVKSLKTTIFHSTLLSAIYAHQAKITGIRIGENDTITIECGEIIEVPDVIADYLLTMVLCMVPFDTCRSDSWQVIIEFLLRDFNHPEVVPALVWMLAHSELSSGVLHGFFGAMSGPQAKYLVRIIHSNQLGLTREQMTSVVRALASASERICNVDYSDALHHYLQENLDYLMTNEHVLIESILSSFGTWQYSRGLELIFKLLLTAVEQYRSSAVFSAKLLSPGLIRRALINYGQVAVPFLHDKIEYSNDLMVQVISQGVLFDIEYPSDAHDFYQKVNEYLVQNRLDQRGVDGYVAFHQASHSYPIDFVVPAALSVPFYLRCEAFFTHRRIDPKTSPRFLMNEFGTQVLAKRFSLEAPAMQIEILNNLLGQSTRLDNLFIWFLSTPLELNVVVKVIEVAIQSTVKSEQLYLMSRERLNAWAAAGDPKKVLYGHDLLSHFEPVLLHLADESRLIPVATIEQISKVLSDCEGEHSLPYFCAQYLLKFHNNYSHLDVILRTICASPRARDIVTELCANSTPLLFVAALEEQGQAIKRKMARSQFRSMTKRDEVDIEDIKYRVLCEYLLIKTRDQESFTLFRNKMEGPHQGFSQRGGPQLTDFERAARRIATDTGDRPLFEYEVMFPDLKSVYDASLAALALALLKDKASLPVLMSFLHSSHYDIKVPYRALELFGEHAIAAIKTTADKTTDSVMASALQKVLQQISNKQMSLDHVLASIQSHNAELTSKSDLLSYIAALKEYPDNETVKAAIIAWIPQQSDLEIISRSIEIFLTWKPSTEIADFCAEHLHYYDRDNNLALLETVFKVFSAHMPIVPGVKFLLNKMSQIEFTSGCVLAIGKIYENAYICHERDFESFSLLRYDLELKETVIGSLLEVLNHSVQKSKQTNDVIQSTVRALRPIVQVYQTRIYPEDDTFDLTCVMHALQLTAKRVTLHWPLQQLLLSTVVQMCFRENLTGPGRIIDSSGVAVVLTWIDDQLHTIQRTEDINWLARTVQEFLSVSKHDRALDALIKLYEATECQNTRLAEILCAFENARVIPVVRAGLTLLLNRSSVTSQELGSYTRGLVQLQPEGLQVLRELMQDPSVMLKEKSQITLALAQHGAVTLEHVKSLFWDLIDMGLFHPALPYDARKQALLASLDYLSQGLTLLDAVSASQCLNHALMIYTSDEEICGVLETSLKLTAQQTPENTAQLDTKYLPSTVLAWAGKNRPSSFTDSFYRVATVLRETVRMTDKTQIRNNKKILLHDLKLTAQIFIDMYYYGRRTLDYDQLKALLTALEADTTEASAELCFSLYSPFTMHQLLHDLEAQLTPRVKCHVLAVMTARDTCPWWLTDRVKVASLFKVLVAHLSRDDAAVLMTDENTQRLHSIHIANDDFVWQTRFNEVVSLLSADKADNK